jgi:hypothetical protein
MLITASNEGNDRAPLSDCGSEPSLFTIINDGVSLNPKDEAKLMKGEPFLIRFCKERTLIIRFLSGSLDVIIDVNSPNRNK